MRFRISLRWLLALIALAAGLLWRHDRPTRGMGMDDEKSRAAAPALSRGREPTEKVGRDQFEPRSGDTLSSGR